MLNDRDLEKIQKVVKSTIKEDVDPQFKSVKKSLKRIEKKLDYSIGFLDREYLKLAKRVNITEAKLGVPRPH